MGKKPNFGRSKYVHELSKAQIANNLQLGNIFSRTKSIPIQAK